MCTGHCLQGSSVRVQYNYTESFTTCLTTYSHIILSCLLLNCPFTLHGRKTFYKTLSGATHINSCGCKFESTFAPILISLCMRITHMWTVCSSDLKGRYFSFSTGIHIGATSIVTNRRVSEQCPSVCTIIS
jgi:hypothetical protein